MPTLLFIVNDSALLGIIGGIVSGMAAYILVRDKAYRKDIKERNDLLNTQFKTISDMNEEAQKNIKENTSILAGLKTLLEISVRNA